MFTIVEVVAMDGKIISSVYDYLSGKIVTLNSNTYNYYIQHPEGTWENYDCRTRS